MVEPCGIDIFANRNPVKLLDTDDAFPSQTKEAFVVNVEASSLTSSTPVATENVFVTCAKIW